MPKTLFQDFVYTVIMVIVMVYAMVVYNVAWDAGVSNQIFLLALKELPIMAPIAFVLEFFLIGRLSQRIARRLLDPAKVPPILFTVAVSSVIVAFMCPLMSFIASLLFGYTAPANIVTTFLRIFVRNFPMALCWQLFYAGPLVRFLFRLIFVRRKKGSKGEEATPAAEVAAAEQSASAQQDHSAEGEQYVLSDGNKEH